MREGEAVPTTLPPTSRFVDGDLTMLVRRWDAAPGAGTTPFVLVHGIGVSSRYFRRLAVELTRFGTVYAVDLPGFGGSPRPPGQLTVEAGAALLEAFLRSEGMEGAILVGHSMGSQWVVETAAVHGSRVGGIVIAGAVVDERARQPWQQGMRLGRDVLRESPTANWIVATDYMRSGLRWYFTELPVMLGYPIEQRLPLVSVPVLVLRGARDPIAPRAWSVKLARMARDGRFVEVPSAAHVVQHTKPTLVAGILADFVTDAVASDSHVAPVPPMTPTPHERQGS